MESSSSSIPSSRPNIVWSARIGSFARFALELLALGAPPPLLHAALEGNDPAMVPWRCLELASS